MDPDDVLRPTLLIGLGGSGVRTLQLVKRELQEWTERNGRGRDLPARWQFLCIDLPVAPDPADLHSVEGIGLEPHEYLGLAASVPANPQRSTIVRTLAAIPGSEHDLAGWLPDDWEPPVRSDHLLAAHVRAIGLLALPEIHDALTSALARTAADGPSERDPLVVIIGSLAGRTGSVLLRDVLETLGQIAPRAAESAITIAFTPECFPQEVGPTAYPRALATLNELINLVWSRDDTDTAEGDDADRSQGRGLRRSLLPTSGPVARYYPALVYLVGPRSTGRWSGAPATAAAVVTSILTDPGTRSDFFYAQVNASSAHWVYNQGAVLTDAGLWHAGAPILCALGHARVSSGTEELRDYASHILARAAAARLADGGSGPTSSAPGLRLPDVDVDDWDAAFRALLIDTVEAEAAKIGIRATSDLVKRLMADAVARPEPATRALVHDLLEPVLEALEQATSQLRSAPAAMPAPGAAHQGRLTVLDASKFSEVLGQLLAQTYGTDPRTAMELAAIDVARGSGDDLRLMTVRTPDPDTSQAPSDSSQCAHVSGPVSIAMHCRTEDLLARAQDWLAREGTPLAEFLQHDLRSIVSVPDGAMPDGSSTRHREDRLISCIREAAADAAPGVELDDYLTSQIDPRPFRPEFRTLSRLPFRNHPLQERARELVADLINRPSESVERVLTEVTESRHVDVITHGRQVELLTIASLMRPIAFQWERVRNNATQAQAFMLEGRARPLAESLPLPTAQLRAMMRGWFTGRVLGLVDARPDADPPAVVQDPLRGPHRAWFIPGGPSQTAETSLDLLADVLESFTFAQLEVSKAGSLAPLNAYWALRDLGMSDTSRREALGYPKLAPVLAEWIHTGVVHGGDVLPDAALHPKLAAAEDPEARRDALAGLFDSMISEVEDLRREHVADEGPRPRHWREAPAWLSLDDHILASLRALVRATRGHLLGDLI